MTTTSDRTGLAFLCLFAFVTLAPYGTKDQPQPVELGREVKETFWPKHVQDAVFGNQ